MTKGLPGGVCPTGVFDQVTARAPRRGLRITVAVSALVHAGALAAALAASVWSVDRLRPKYVQVEWAVAPTPPPPAREAAAPAAPRPVAARRPATAQPPAVTQPVPTEPRDPTAPAPVDPGGTGTPNEPGVPGGTGTGPGVPGGSGTEPVVEPAPQKITIDALAALRISGDTQIRLPPSLLRSLSDQGVHRVDVMVRLCLSAAGTPETVEIVKSSGSAEADDRVRDGVRAWRYRPYTVNGRAVPACAGVLMRYEIE
ncbi:MAG TPA: TonB family protein [Haliangiales bacterium]|nr:TonB family protein [Haliangiales bacterium]